MGTQTHGPWGQKKPSCTRDAGLVSKDSSPRGLSHTSARRAKSIVPPGSNPVRGSDWLHTMRCTWRTLNTATRKVRSSICDSVNGSLGAFLARVSCRKEKEGKKGSVCLLGPAPARGGLRGRPHAQLPRHRDHRHGAAIITLCREEL
jgi:hypothetical protein